MEEQNAFAVRLTEQAVEVERKRAGGQRSAEANGRIQLVLPAKSGQGHVVSRFVPIEGQQRILHRSDGFALRCDDDTAQVEVAQRVLPRRSQASHFGRTASLDAHQQRTADVQSILRCGATPNVPSTLEMIVCPLAPLRRLFQRVVRPLARHETPGAFCIALYHKRWEEELGFDEQKAHQDPRGASKPANLRSEMPAGVLQKLYALPLVHFVTRALMFEAAKTESLDPTACRSRAAFRFRSAAFPNAA